MRIVKEELKKSDSGTLKDRLAKILFQYRITPHTTTGVAPSQLLMGRRIRLILDILKPSGMQEHVQAKQERQKKDHDQRVRNRNFVVGQNVYVKFFCWGGKRWLKGKLSRRLGPVSFKVWINNGRIVHCHQDQIRARNGKEHCNEKTNESESVENHQESPLPAVVVDPVPSISVGTPEVKDSTESTTSKTIESTKSGLVAIRYWTHSTSPRYPASPMHTLHFLKTQIRDTPHPLIKINHTHYEYH